MGLEASNFEKAMYANAAFGGEAYTGAEIYTAKFFEDVVDLEGVGTEITTLDYEPIEFTSNTTNFPHTTTGAKANAVQFISATFGADSPEIVSVGLFDEDDNLRFRKVFDTPFIIPEGQYGNIAVGALTFVVTSI